MASSEKIHLGALEEGVLLYVAGDQPPFDRVPHRLTNGRLAPVPTMGVVTAEQHDPRWLEFYGRWPNAMWKIVLPSSPGDAAISRWTDGAWRSVAPIPEECDLSLVGHSFAGALLVATNHCAEKDGPLIHLYALDAGGQSRVGPPLAEMPQLALATAEGLYVAGFFAPRAAGGAEQTIQRFACAAPYDCVPEVLSLAELPGVLTWIDHTWQRQWQGLAHRQGVSIVHQRRSDVLEAHLLEHDAEGWRTVPAPGRITGLLAVADARVVVTRAPAGDAELANGDWPESKPTQRGDTLWLLGKGETDWRPIHLPAQVPAASGLQVAVEGPNLWLAASEPAGGVTLFSAPVDVG